MTNTGFKRARTEVDFSPAQAPPFQPTDLSKPHPLDLSSDLTQRRTLYDSSPFDYSINRSDLISGQLSRLKNMDNRSGI